MNRKSLSILKLSTTENSYLSNKPQKNRVSFSNIKKVRLIENPRQKFDETDFGSDKEISITSEESVRNSFTEPDKNLLNRSVKLKNSRKHKFGMSQNKGKFKNQEFSFLNLTDANIESDNVKQLKPLEIDMDNSFQLSDDSFYDVKENIPLKRRKIEKLNKSSVNTSMFIHGFSKISEDNVNVFNENSENVINNDSQVFEHFLDETFIDSGSKVDQEINNNYRKIDIEPIGFENSINNNSLNKSFSICENIMDMSMIDKSDCNNDGLCGIKLINHETDFECQLNANQDCNSVEENNLSIKYVDLNKPNLFYRDELVSNKSICPYSASIIKDGQNNILTNQKESISDISFNIDINVSSVDCTNNLPNDSQTDIDWSVSQSNVIDKEYSKENSFLKIKSYEVSSPEVSELEINFSIPNLVSNEESIDNNSANLEVKDSANSCQQAINFQQLDLSNNQSINEMENVSLHDKNIPRLDISFIPNENDFEIISTNSNHGDSIKINEQDNIFVFNDFPTKLGNSMFNVSLHSSNDHITTDDPVIQQSNIINSEELNILTNNNSKCLLNISEIPKDNDCVQYTKQSISTMNISCIAKDDSWKINFTDEFDFNASNVNHAGESYSHIKDTDESIFLTANIVTRTNLSNNAHSDSTHTEQIENNESHIELTENSKYNNDNFIVDNESIFNLNMKLKSQDVNSSLSKEEFVNWTFNKETGLEDAKFSNHSVNMNESSMNDENSFSNDDDVLNKAVLSINMNDSLCDTSENLNESSNIDQDLDFNLCRDSISEKIVQLNPTTSNFNNTCNYHESIQSENINSFLNEQNNDMLENDNVKKVDCSIFQSNDFSIFQTYKDDIGMDISNSLEHSQQYSENKNSTDFSMLNDFSGINSSFNDKVVEKESMTKIPSSSVINFSSLESNVFKNGFDEMSSIENIRDNQCNSLMDSFCNFTFDVNNSLSFNQNYNLENTESVKMTKSNQFVTPKNAFIDKNTREFFKTTTLSDIFLTPVSSDLKFTPLQNKNIFSVDTLIPVNTKQIDIDISLLDEKCYGINNYLSLNESFLEINQTNLNSIINIGTKSLQRNIHPEICRFFVEFIGNPILKLMNFYKQSLREFNKIYKEKYDSVNNLKSKILSKCRICQRKQVCIHYSELKNLQQDIFNCASRDYDLLVTNIRIYYNSIIKMGMNSMKIEISKLNFKMKRILHEKQAKCLQIDLNNEIHLMENRIKKPDILVSTLMKMQDMDREKEIYIKTKERQKADYYRFIINSKINPLIEVFITNNVTNFLLMGSRVKIVAKIRNENEEMYIESASVDAHDCLYPMKANIEQYFQKLIDHQLINRKTTIVKEKILDYQMPILLLLGDVNLCASLKKFVITFDQNQPFILKSQMASRSPLARFTIYIDLNPISTYQHRPLQYQIQIDYKNVDESKIKQLLNTTNHGLNKLYRLFENLDKALPDIVLE